MTPPVVCFVIRSLEVGGTERHLLQVLPALSRAGLRCMLYTLTHAGPLADQMRDGGVEVLQPTFAIPRRDRWPQRAVVWPTTSARLFEVLRERRPAIVHHYLPSAYLVGAPCAALARVPRQLMSRRSLNVYQTKHPVLARVERSLHRFMRAILCNSRAIVDELVAEGAPSERLALVPNGVDLRRFATLPDPAAARARLGLAMPATVALHVANLNEHKGHADLLDGIASVRSRLPADFVLLCAGRDDGIGGALQERAAALGIASSVRWLGSRPDIPELLAAADFAISASHHEGSSNAVLEAMAAGRPVVATAVGGTPEAVTSGVHGLLVPPRDPPSFGRALAQMAGDPAIRARMGSAAARRIEHDFSLPACVARYLALYDSVLSDRPLPASVCGLAQ
ncbi:MAG TPA: glycosyltransferase [Nannocystaceae bacterium]|nr:glycosyltransferase [Nannocystaceae bacterium]